MNVDDNDLTTEVGGETISIRLEQLCQCWAAFTELYGLPVAQYCIGLIYSIYVHFTFANAAVFLFKYIPIGIYTYKFVKDLYIASRDRLRQGQATIEDIQLQIQIVSTKLCVRDAEFRERVVQLRRDAESLRRVRARVRGIIAADDALRRALDVAAAQDAERELRARNAAREEDREFIVELIKELKYDQVAAPERPAPTREGGERTRTAPSTPENSICSSGSEDRILERQDCRVKIVKVTNVYKVAYLKHYIKQKRLRRATKQALLKKKMESIKKLLEDWQKTLNMVINSKLTVLNIDAHPMDVASQDAMGDYSKPHEYSDSDSDMRSSATDMWYDEYGLSWSQNPHRPYSYNYEDVTETAISREYYDSQDYETKYPLNSMQQCDRGCPNGKITCIVEETLSQIAIEETQSNASVTEDDCEYPDLITF